MDSLDIMSVAALLALLPAAILPFRRQASRPDGLYWALLLVALLGGAAYIFSAKGDGWDSSFSQALWLSIVCSLALFLILALLTPQAWRLSALLCPYLVLMGLLAAAPPGPGWRRARHRRRWAGSRRTA